jgi:hypothetical protein
MGVVLPEYHLKFPVVLGTLCHIEPNSRPIAKSSTSGVVERLLGHKQIFVPLDLVLKDGGAYPSAPKSILLLIAPFK